MKKKKLLVVGTSLLALASASPAFAVSQKPVCPGPVSKGMARCHAHVVTDGQGRPLGKPQPSTPALKAPALRAAYGVGAASLANGTGRTIAIVDAYHYPSALSDLNNYRTDAGNGMSALDNCAPDQTSACFQQTDQLGNTTWPKTDTGWAEEEALDLDMASAMCPNCKLILVEANSSSLADLGIAVNTAAGLGANVISNSYGGNEFLGEDSATYSGPYDHPGIAITVSSGDSGYGVEFPAAANTVTAVGGTSLRQDSSTRGWTETAWSGAGSGCSAVVAKPLWQTDGACSTKRIVADVSADADPNTGVAVYDSFGHTLPWLQFGGTSVAAPLVGGIYAIGGALSGYAPQYTWGHASTTGTAPTLNEVSSGSNGRRCSPSYLCTARVGYDGPTGLGTPKGTGAF